MNLLVVFLLTGQFVSITKNKMKQLKTIFLSGIAALLLCLNAFSADNEKVTVVVEFNGSNHNINKEVTYTENMSALDALMYIATIQTHPVGKYVFVDAINNVFNVKNCNAWYFTVNNTPSQVLAISKTLEPGDTVKWIYKKDVCSKTIEKEKPTDNNFGF